ncbi:MAG: hypothetical protein UR72_C0010G0008 [Parcubacteria group bacterium GW2011_GWC1_35_21]|nr:MAG: hypothetical protein UR72_C0010G0008 [Parcubacteria group bacterium GW2011_GWC1_35_21]
MKDPQKLLQEIKEINARTKKKLDEIDSQIAEIDLEYAKLLIKENIDNLKIAKKILSA